MAILNSKSGGSYNTDTGLRTNADGSTTQVNNIVNGEATPIANLNNTPVITPTPPISSTTGNLGTNVNSTVAGVGADITTAPTTDPATANVTNMMNTYLNDVKTPPADIATAQTEEIAKKRNALKIQNELTTMDKAYRDEITNIEKNAQGKLSSGIEAEKNIATDRYNNNRANVSIAYNTAIGDYNSAQETVALKTQAYTDRKDAEYKAWEMNYKMASEFMTPAQKQEAELLKAKKLQDIQDLSGAKNTVMANMLQNGAPQSVWNAVDSAASLPNATASSIMSAAGQYGIDKYQQAQTNALNKKTTPGIGGNLSANAQAVVDNPNLLNSFTATVKGNVIAELQTAGYDTSNLGVKALSTGEIEKVAETQKALTDIQVLTDSIDKNLQYIGPVSGFQALNPWSKARQVQADIDRVKQTIGKALEGGVLRKEDEEKYKKILPTVNDTEETARYKLQQLNTTLQADLERYTSLLQSGGRSTDVTASLQKKGSAVTGTSSSGNSYTITQN